MPVGRKDHIKRYIWVLWFASLVTLLGLGFGHWTLEPLYHIPGGISISQPQMYIIYYGVLAIFVTNSLLIGKRASCHYICWIAPFMMIGRFVGNKLKAPRLQLTKQSDACVSCHRCTTACPMGIDVHALVQTNRLEHPECIFCNECVHACSKDVLKIRFIR